MCRCMSSTIEHEKRQRESDLEARHKELIEYIDRLHFWNLDTLTVGEHRYLLKSLEARLFPTFNEMELTEEVVEKMSRLYQRISHP